jgi:hypothetical protein
MNHCHDCNSTYATPGTCNCFAPGGKRAVLPVNNNTFVVPYWPAPWTVPVYPVPTITEPRWYYQPTITTSSTVTLDAALAGASNSCGM